MTSPTSVEAISPLRRRMIEDMSIRKFTEKTQQDYIRHVENFAKFLRRSPDTATAEDLRRYQLHQTQSGHQPRTLPRLHCASFSQSRLAAAISRASSRACITRASCHVS